MLIGPTDENQQTKSLTALHSCIMGQKKWRQQQRPLAATRFHKLNTIVTNCLPALKAGGRAIYATGG